MKETIQESYRRLHRMETDEIVEYAYNLEQELDQANKKLEDLKSYINFLVIFEPNIGRFNKTIWGEELLSIIDMNNK